MSVVGVMAVFCGTISAIRVWRKGSVGQSGGDGGGHARTSRKLDQEKEQSQQSRVVCEYQCQEGEGLKV